MPLRINVDVRGAEGVAKLLADVRKQFLPGKVQNALLPAAEIVADDARRRVNIGPGVKPSGQPRKHLRDAIYASIGKPGLPNVIAGVSHRTAPHAHLVEFGTEAHSIVPRFGDPVRGGRTRRVLHWIEGGLRVFTPWVDHPGAKKAPFFRPAVRATRGRVLQAIEAACKRLLFTGLPK